MNLKNSALAHFWSIFPIFGQKMFFLQNPALSCTTSYGFLAQYQNLRKTNAVIPRKCPERWEDRRTDGRTEERTDAFS